MDFGDLSRLLMWCCKQFLKLVLFLGLSQSREACTGKAPQQITTSKLRCRMDVSTQAARRTVHHSFGVFDVILYPAALINLCGYSDCTCISSSRWNSTVCFLMSANKKAKYFISNKLVFLISASGFLLLFCALELMY